MFESIDTGALIGLRDRAPLSVMLYSFARVSARPVRIPLVENADDPVILGPPACATPLPHTIGKSSTVGRDTRSPHNRCARKHGPPNDADPET